MLSLLTRIQSWFRHVRPVVSQAQGAQAVPGRVDHIIILDGTLSSLDAGYETNAGLLFKLLAEKGLGADRRLYYEPGVQWVEWGHLADVARGRGINRQIRRAYGVLASHYRPGDRVYLLGYSRGAYAVRSLAGAIDQVGLLKPEHATQRNVRQAYRHYQLDPGSPAAKAFARQFCHEAVPIEMVGVWDTVKALGVRLPFLWMLTEHEHAFHNHALGHSIKHGFQALALHETRVVFTPVLWTCPPNWSGNIEQMWFRGSHADIGGQIGSFPAARPLSNIPLVWMLERMEACGIALPEGWKNRYPCDAAAPSVGTWRGFGALFLLRRRRVVGADPSESIHPTALSQQSRWGWRPKIVRGHLRQP
ncbi:DUF2235 domain-containing protein [Pseudorhodobacter turbinis]|uniref:DUF2235 domain-containing protein n=1 Tax=Pseudorhodobacter turbinis TaxID=2500533 RepID=A0A4P8EE50_9RHOB|nr:DUF2235 domain-containing protein [Pseudorhodobacter turbinis]